MPKCVLACIKDFEDAAVPRAAAAVAARPRLPLRLIHAAAPPVGMPFPPTPRARLESRGVSDDIVAGSIVVGVDGRPEAHDAVAAAGRLATQLRLELVLVHVLERGAGDESGEILFDSLEAETDERRAGARGARR